MSGLKAGPFAWQVEQSVHRCSRQASERMGYRVWNHMQDGSMSRTIRLAVWNPVVISLEKQICGVRREERR